MIPFNDRSLLANLDVLPNKSSMSRNLKWLYINYIDICKHQGTGKILSVYDSVMETTYDYRAYMCVTIIYIDVCI